MQCTVYTVYTIYAATSRESSGDRCAFIFYFIYMRKEAIYPGLAERSGYWYCSGVSGKILYQETIEQWNGERTILRKHASTVERVGLDHSRNKRVADRPVLATGLVVLLLFLFTASRCRWLAEIVTFVQCTSGSD